MARKSKGETKSAECISLPVQFGGFAAGDGVCSIGLVLRKGSEMGCMSASMAEFYLCGARCEVEISVDPNASPAGANTDGLFDDADELVKATADIKAYRSTKAGITASVVFNNEEVDEAQVLKFRKQRGYVRLERLGDIPVKQRKSKGETAATKEE